MKNRYFITGIIFISLWLVSCGTNKKLEASQRQVDDLKTQNADLQKSVDGLNTQLSDINERDKKIAAEFVKYHQECELTQKKYEVARAILNDQVETLEQIEKKLETALADFSDKGVEVYYKNGYVYVSMEDNLLYKSGSSVLDSKGIEALGKVASVLNDYPKLKVVVLGNTDDVMFKKGTDNWSLSTERANGVVRLFRDKYSVDPIRLTAAGKSKYNPVADNSTAEGRAKNRRTDIILNPDMDKIWESAENQ